jgi:hypothetical protein
MESWTCQALLLVPVRFGAFLLEGIRFARSQRCAPEARSTRTARGLNGHGRGRPENSPSHAGRRRGSQGRNRRDVREAKGARGSMWREKARRPGTVEDPQGDSTGGRREHAHELGRRTGRLLERRDVTIAYQLGLLYESSPRPAVYGCFYAVQSHI